MNLRRLKKRDDTKRVQGLELLAMLMIGSGVVRMLMPQRHAMRWAVGPMSGPAEWMRDHPNATRASGVVRLVAGLWLLKRIPE